MSDSVRPHRCQPTAPPSLGFPRQENWSGLPLPSPLVSQLVKGKSKISTKACPTPELLTRPLGYATCWLVLNTWRILCKCLLTDSLIDTSFVYSFFLSALAPGCCSGFPLVAESRGRSLVAALGPPIAAASLVAEHRLRVCERQ